MEGETITSYITADSPEMGGKECVWARCPVRDRDFGVWRGKTICEHTIMGYKDVDECVVLPKGSYYRLTGLIPSFDREPVALHAFRYNKHTKEDTLLNYLKELGVKKCLIILSIILIICSATVIAAHTAHPGIMLLVFLLGMYVVIGVWWIIDCTHRLNKEEKEREKEKNNLEDKEI